MKIETCPVRSFIEKSNMKNFLTGIKQNIKLSDFNTFRTGGNARFFCEANNEKDLLNALKFAKEKKIKFFVIGNGSNLLMRDENFSGIIIKMSIKGIKIESRNRKNSIISSYAGELFDDFISFAIGNNLFGMENLWNIPGTLGGAVVQNIGAYGTEIKNLIISVEGLNANNLKKFIFKNENCNFKYRESVFKKNKNLIITKVFFKLNNHFSPNLEYPLLKDYFLGEKPSDIKEVIRAIEKIRKSKLPDWRALGTAGSFFKNPVIAEGKYEELLIKYPDLPSYYMESDLVKIPLGYVIDKICGLKGLKKGRVGLYEKQSLVIVNYGGATFFEINYFAKIIEKKVFEKTKIKIEREVEIIGF